MPVNYTDLSANLDAIDFRMVLGTASLISSYTKVLFPYTGIANPQLTDVAIVTAQYSLDDGATYSDMTAASGTVVSGLTFSTAGASLTYTWDIKVDITTSIYNNPIYVKFLAQSGSQDAVLSTGIIYFAKTTSDQSTPATKPFPDDYKGQAGYELVQRFAPKSNVR